MLCHYNCSITVLLLVARDSHKDVSDITDSRYKLVRKEGWKMPFILLAQLKAAVIIDKIFRLCFSTSSNISVLKFPGHIVISFSGYLEIC